MCYINVLLFPFLIVSLHNLTYKCKLRSMRNEFLVFYWSKPPNLTCNKRKTSIVYRFRNFLFELQHGGMEWRLCPVMYQFEWNSRRICGICYCCAHIVHNVVSDRVCDTRSRGCLPALIIAGIDIADMDGLKGKLKTYLLTSSNLYFCDIVFIKRTK